MNGRLWFSTAVVAAALGFGAVDDGGGTPVTTNPLCKVKEQNDGSKPITCDDGTTASVRNGMNDGKGPPGAMGERGPQGDPGSDGDAGMDGTSCAATDNGDETKTIAWTDGTTVTVAGGTKGDAGAKGDPGSDGKSGVNGTACSVVDNGDGTKTIACPGRARVRVGPAELVCDAGQRRAPVYVVPRPTSCPSAVPSGLAGLTINCRV